MKIKYLSIIQYNNRLWLQIYIVLLKSLYKNGCATVITK